MPIKIGVVGLPDLWSTMALIEQIRKKTGQAILVDPGTLKFCSVQQTVHSGSLDLLTLDGLIIKKIGQTYNPDLINRLELLAFLNNKGLPIFSSPRSIMAGFSRLGCTMILQIGGIPMPPLRICEDSEAAVDAIKEFGQAVLKPLYSTKARGMILLDADEPGLLKRVEEFKQIGNPTLYIQKKVSIPGRDMGVVFLGGRYLATYARVKSEDSWNTTTVNGGHYMKHTPSQEILDMAYQAQALFNLDYTCVDIAETDTGPVVFEVSVFGGFRGLVEGCGVDAPSLLTDYVINKVNS